MSNESVLKTPGPKGKRNRERIEVKGNVYTFISRYDMTFFKDEIIKLLYDIRVISTNQLLRIYGDRYSARWIRSVLQNLYEHNFVFRKFTLSNEKGSRDAVYFLDRIGALYLANEIKTEFKNLKWSPADNAIGPDALKHTIDITEIRTSMEEHSRQYGAELRKFIGERRIGRIKFLKDDNELEFNPDAEIILAYQGKLLLYLLEYDTGSESKSMIEEKIEKYEAFYSSKEFKEFYPIHPHILIIGSDAARTQRLKMWIDNKRRLTEMNYLFANLGDVSRDPFGYIYDSYRANEKINLINL